MEQLFNLVVAKNERVAATQEHVAHFGMTFEITKRFLEIGVQFLFADATNHAAAGARSTVARATIGHQKQDAIWVPMDKPRHRHVRIFAARVSHVVGGCPRLLDPRNYLTPD